MARVCLRWVTFLFKCRWKNACNRYHIWSAAWQSTGAQRLEELSEHGQARPSQHWSPEGNRSGERKRPTFHPLKSETICVQPDKHCHCFEGNFGETAERQGGVHIGLSEHYDAILSWNWNWIRATGKTMGSIASLAPGSPWDECTAWLG